MREIFWEPEAHTLIALPMQELSLLHNDTLFSGSVKLVPGNLFTPPLPSGTGDTIDLFASFDISAATSTSFGLSVLANNDSILGSATVTVNCSADDSKSGANCVASGAIAHPPPPPPGMAPNIPPAWPGSRLVNLSRMMPNMSFPGGSISGDATVKSIEACQQSCDALPACQTWTAFCTANHWENCPSIRCTMKSAVEKTGCPVGTSGGVRPFVSGVKVPGLQRCSVAPHGFLAPRMDWLQPFNLPKATTSIDMRVLVDRKFGVTEASALFSS